MSQIPAICINPTCETIFPSSFNFKNAFNIQMTNCISGPCPNCGWNGKVLDGIYNAFGDTIYAVLNQQSSDIELLKKIVSTIKQDLARAKNPEEIKKNLQSKFPKFKALWDWIPTKKIIGAIILGIIINLLSSNIEKGASWCFNNKEAIIDNALKFYQKVLPQKTNQIDDFRKKYNIDLTIDL